LTRYKPAFPFYKFLGLGFIMNKCLNCKKETINPKFCSRSCSVSFNNTLHPKRNNNGRRTTTEELRKMSKIAKEKRVIDRISMFEKGELSDIQIRHGGTIKEYVIKQQNGKCAVCGISFIEPIWMGQKVPFTVDHIDGDYKNNNPMNIRIICPICDRLSPTYGSRNNGKGRPKDKR
jgi:hypothetical protein